MRATPDNLSTPNLQSCLKSRDATDNRLVRPRYLTAFGNDHPPA
jgi:hypothetical protein